MVTSSSRASKTLYTPASSATPGTRLQLYSLPGNPG
jgi:hypothetical protein